MKTIIIPEGTTTPGFSLKPQENEIMLWGQACPEDAYDFYEPIINKLKEYFATKPQKVNFIFNISYYNTASSKIIVSILQMLDNLKKQGSDVKIIWFYDPDDEDMMIAGEDFSEIVDIPFELKTNRDV